MKIYGKSGNWSNQMTESSIQSTSSRAAAAADIGIYIAAVAATSAANRRRRRRRIFVLIFSNIRRTIKIRFCNISESTLYITIKFCSWTFWFIIFTKMQKKNSFWPESSFGSKISWPSDILLGDLGDQMYHFIHLTLEIPQWEHGHPWSTTQHTRKQQTLYVIIEYYILYYMKIKKADNQWKG